MTNFIKLIGTLALTFTFASVTHGNGAIFIGNAGEGVVLPDGQILLRDLAEAGILRPSFGDKIDESLSAAVERISMLPMLQINKSLLKRKLTDLNTISPKLGEILALSLAIYQWNFVRGDALRVNPEDPLTAHDERRVELATRLLGRISVNYDAFVKMNDVQRVALLIHEGLFSLLKVKCNLSICSQSSPEARALVSRLFKPGAEFDLNLREMLSLSLAIPDKDVLCQVPSVEVQFRLTSLLGERNSLVSSSQSDPVSVRSYPALDDQRIYSDLSTLACSSEARDGRPASDLRAVVEASVQMLKVHSFIYESSFGKQYGVAVEPFQAHLKTIDQSDEQSDGKRSCEANLSVRLFSFVSAIHAYQNAIETASYCQ